ncbi:hypothetical protein M413DRAFT_132344 [Hebeloma cylindrosporum]|uniref:Uncharacterized protein n=1 Tax=Hebeloma cylindrosporum TaxID=76867 RepID=A0A0C3CDR6_HEBCY|nr:hypothetical protein M413DRAFT_132344 [Hebeloma cylindrosporum h7]
MVEPTLGNTIGAAFLGMLGSAMYACFFRACSCSLRESTQSMSFRSRHGPSFRVSYHFKNDWRLQKFFFVRCLVSFLVGRGTSNHMFFTKRSAGSCMVHFSTRLEETKVDTSGALSVGPVPVWR